MKAADLLLKAGALTQEQYASVAILVKRRNERSEEVMIDHGTLSEADLMKALAAVYRTQFVTTEKLARAPIPRSTVQLVPQKVAEAFGVFPVLFDAAKLVLSVITADPDKRDVFDEIRIVSGAKEVRPFVARPACISAAILKHYRGDARAFAALETAAHTSKLSSRTSSITPQAFGASQGPSRLPDAPLTIDIPIIMPVAAPKIESRPPEVVPPSEATPAKAPAAASAVRAPAPTGRHSIIPGGLISTPPEAPSVFSDDTTLELLAVMVSLLENGRQELRGHSSHVARLVRRIAERMKLPAADTFACVVAAYVHDLGKMGQYHLTALNVGEYDGHMAAAQKSVESPLRILESVSLTQAIERAVFHMYERHDGKGFPEGLVGKEIPLGARILALADTYADLTQNARNPFRRVLTPQEAVAAIDAKKGKIFDPGLVDLFRTLVVGEDVRARLLSARHSLLLVDADPEETTVLELRLVEQGFDVQIARTHKTAVTALTAPDVRFDVVLAELELPDGDGLELLEAAKKGGWAGGPAWVVHTRRQERGDAQRAFQLGAADYVAKPAQGDVLVAKLKAMLGGLATKASKGGVAGSLREMSLPDIVQVLYHGRKTGKLVLRAGAESGEIHFLEGQVAHAIFAKRRGADAFYALLRLTDGEFSLDPTFVPEMRVIEESAEALLLEGMRRLDEGL